jgi:hypothetical protein
MQQLHFVENSGHLMLLSLMKYSILTNINKNKGQHGHSTSIHVEHLYFKCYLPPQHQSLSSEPDKSVMLCMKESWTEA